MYIFYICTDRVGKWPKNQKICSRLFEDCETKINYVPSEVTIVDNSRIYSVTSFLFLKIESWNFQHLIDLGSYEFSFSQNFSSFGQLLFFWAHVTIWVQIQLLTRDVTNQDVLLLATIRYLQHTIYLLENNLNLDLCLEVHILYVRHPLQDLLSSLNTVISTNQSTRFIT